MKFGFHTSRSYLTGNEGPCIRFLPVRKINRKCSFPFLNFSFLCWFSIPLECLVRPTNYFFYIYRPIVKIYIDPIPFHISHSIQEQNKNIVCAWDEYNRTANFSNLRSNARIYIDRTNEAKSG